MKRYRQRLTTNKLRVESLLSLFFLLLHPLSTLILWLFQCIFNLLVYWIKKIKLILQIYADNELKRVLFFIKSGSIRTFQLITIFTLKNTYYFFLQFDFSQHDEHKFNRIKLFFCSGVKKKKLQQLISQSYICQVNMNATKVWTYYPCL